MAAFPLVASECRKQRKHTLVWIGMALCCMTDYTQDPVLEPGSAWQNWYAPMSFNVGGPSPERYPRSMRPKVA